MKFLRLRGLAGCFDIFNEHVMSKQVSFEYQPWQRNVGLRGSSVRIVHDSHSRLFGVMCPQHTTSLSFIALVFCWDNISRPSSACLVSPLG